MAVQVRKALKILIGLYICANIFGLLASLPMIKHVYEKSECILFSHEVTKGGSLSYGHHASKFFICELFHGKKYYFGLIVFKIHKTHFSMNTHIFW